jgi:hypothetical protein
MENIQLFHVITAAKPASEILSVLPKGNNVNRPVCLSVGKKYVGNCSAVVVYTTRDVASEMGPACNWTRHFSAVVATTKPEFCD